MNEDIKEQSGSEIVLRKATIDDKPGMLRTMAPYTNGYFPGGLQSDRVRIAELSGNMVGFVGWSGNQVLALYVASDWRGKGRVGTKLLAAAEASIGKAGRSSVRAMIDADSTDAYRFYLKHDYESEWHHSNEDIGWMTKTFR